MSDIIERVKELLKLDQSLCKGCGKCCRYAPFRLGYSYDEIKEFVKKIPENEEEKLCIDGAKDFLSVFVPYDDVKAVKKYNPKLVEVFEKTFNKDVTKDKYFFYCKYLDDDNRCLIYNRRPQFCRAHPVVSEHGFLHQGCGFETQIKENWAKIKQILDDIEKQKRELEKLKESYQQKKSEKEKGF